MNAQLETKKFIIKSFSLMAISNAIIKPFWFLLFLFAARMLGTAGFGLFMFFNSIAMMAMIFVDFGLDYITIREASKEGEKLEQYFENTIFIRTIFLLLVSLVLLVYFLLFSNFSIDEILSFYFVLGYLFLTIILNYFRTAISTRYEFAFISKILLMEKLLIVIIGFSALFIFRTVFTFTLSLLISNFISAIIFGIIFKSKFNLKLSKLDLIFIKRLLLLAIPLVVMNIFNTFYFRIDLLLIEYFTGNKQIIGIYGANHRILELFLFVPTILMSVASPIISKNINDRREFTTTFLNRNLQYLLGLSLLLATVFSFNSYGINQLLFGKEYESGHLSFSIIIWTIIPLGLNFVLGNILFILNKEKYLIFSLFFASLVTLSMNWILIPKYSFLGTTITALTTEVVVFLLYIIFIYKYFGRLNLFNYLIKGIVIVFITLSLFLIAEKLFGYSFIPFSIFTGLSVGLQLIAFKFITPKDIFLRKVL